MNETTRDIGTNGGRSESTTSGLGSIRQTTSASEIVRDKVESARQPVADKMHAAADSMRDNADRIPGGETIRGAAGSAADTLDTSASYIESHDSRDMTREAMDVVRRYPGWALLIAGALGFVMGRALRKRT